jgi:predicted transcriptional regulator
VGVLTRADIRKALDNPAVRDGTRSVGEIARANPVEAYPNEPLRVVVNRMAEKGVTRMPVVERSSRRLMGTITLEDLLVARVRSLEHERRRKRVLPLRFTHRRLPTEHMPTKVG